MEGDKKIIPTKRKNIPPINKKIKQEKNIFPKIGKNFSRSGAEIFVNGMGWNGTKVNKKNPPH